MSFRKAMALNFMTSVFALAGFFVGIPIAENEEARLWIFVIAAGMFLYVALADLVRISCLVSIPQSNIPVFLFEQSLGILQMPELKSGAKDMAAIAVQNVGLLSGFVIMFLIAMYEDQIQV